MNPLFRCHFLINAADKVVGSHLMRRQQVGFHRKLLSNTLTFSSNGIFFTQASRRFCPFPPSSLALPLLEFRVLSLNERIMVIVFLVFLSPQVPTHTLHLFLILISTYPDLIFLISSSIDSLSQFLTIGMSSYFVLKKLYSCYLLLQMVA